jgi:hypothetical protein
MGTFAEMLSSVTIYPLPTKENRRPFSLSVCRKQTEVCRFHFPFAENKWKLPFPLVPLYGCGIQETWRHGHGDTDIETWRLRHGYGRHGDGDMDMGDMEIKTGRYRRGDGDVEMETWRWRRGDVETWRHGHMDMETSS